MEVEAWSLRDGGWKLGVDVPDSGKVQHPSAPGESIKSINVGPEVDAEVSIYSVPGNILEGACGSFYCTIITRNKYIEGQYR